MIKKLVNTYKNNDTSIQLFERVLEPPSDLTPEEKRARAKKRKLEYPDWKVAKLFQKDETKKPSKDQLINDEELSDYVEDFIEDLFNDTRGGVYAWVKFSDHYKIMDLDSPVFKRWLYFVYHDINGKNPPEMEVRGAVNMFAGRAMFEGSTKELHVRIAEHVFLKCVVLH